MGFGSDKEASSFVSGYIFQTLIIKTVAPSSYLIVCFAVGDVPAKAMFVEEVVAI